MKAKRILALVPMKGRLLFCFAMIAFSWGASARGVQLSEKELQKASDMIVVATPIETKDLEETTSLGRDTGRTGVTFRGVETTFQVNNVLKGSPAGDRIVLHHYRQNGVPVPAVTDGPDFIGFVLNKNNKLVLHLVKDGPNRYAPATGQNDPALSFQAIGAGASTTGQFSADVSARQYFESYLNQCGTNEIRCLWFLDNNPRIGMVMTIDLGRQTVFTVRDVYNWAHQAAETRTLSHSQVLILKQIINDLPPSDTNSDFDKSLFVSKRNGDKTEVFRYDRGHAPPDVRRIYDIGGGYLP